MPFLVWPLVAGAGALGYKIWDDTNNPKVANHCNVPGACQSVPDTDFMDYAGLAFIAATIAVAYLYSKK